ncbi:MAG TPA: hypothetical protein VHV08_15375 [Pirellulales bacterium]|nr:hypothetical protein [Pirellulales bacterium]
MKSRLVSVSLAVAATVAVICVFDGTAEARGGGGGRGGAGMRGPSMSRSNGSFGRSAGSYDRNFAGSEGRNFDGNRNVDANRNLGVDRNLNGAAAHNDLRNYPNADVAAVNRRYAGTPYRWDGGRWWYAYPGGAWAIWNGVSWANAANAGYTAPAYFDAPAQTYGSGYPNPNVAPPPGYSP